MTKQKPTFLMILLLIFASLAVSCSGSSDKVSSTGDSTVTPTATTDPSGYQMVAPRACLTNEWDTIQSEQIRSNTKQWMQGSLIAWRPGQAAGDWELAYIAPSDTSSWFMGVLTLVKGPKLEEKFFLAPNIQAVGDLTWSPDGRWLAFIAFQQSDAVYTVMTVTADGSQIVNLFPDDFAATDSRSGQKGIIGWKDNDTIQVIASCGEECRLAYNLDVTSQPQPARTPTIVEDFTELNTNLQIHQPLLTVTPDTYPKNLRSANISPDKRQTAYLDRRGILWVLSSTDMVNYIIDIGLREVYETQWSDASDALAIRAEDQIFVFQTPCTK